MTKSIDLLAEERRGDDAHRWPINPIRVVGDLDVDLLGLRLARVHLDLTIAAVDRFLDVIRTRSSGDPNDRSSLSSLTQAELYRLARDANVDGRSTMSRAELVEALADR